MERERRERRLRKVSINSTSYKRSDVEEESDYKKALRFPLIPLLIKEAIRTTYPGYYAWAEEFGFH